MQHSAISEMWASRYWWSSNRQPSVPTFRHYEPGGAERAGEWAPAVSGLYGRSAKGGVIMHGLISGCLSCAEPGASEPSASRYGWRDSASPRSRGRTPPTRCCFKLSGPAMARWPLIRVRAARCCSEVESCSEHTAPARNRMSRKSVTTPYAAERW
jgi:hypothetical protein